jgi:glycerol uptake facilitator-like aquaporin
MHWYILPVVLVAQLVGAFAGAAIAVLAGEQRISLL